MEHAIHLGAGHFIQVVSPTSARTVVKKIKKALRNAKLDDDSVDFDALEADLGSNDGDDDTDTDNDDDGAALEEADFTVGDTIGKSLALVRQVSRLYANGYMLISAFRYDHRHKPRRFLANVAGKL